MVAGRSRLLGFYTVRSSLLTSLPSGSVCPPLSVLWLSFPSEPQPLPDKQRQGAKVTRDVGMVVSMLAQLQESLG